MDGSWQLGRGIAGKVWYIYISEFGIGLGLGICYWERVTFEGAFVYVLVRQNVPINEQLLNNMVSIPAISIISIIYKNPPIYIHTKKSIISTA